MRIPYLQTESQVKQIKYNKIIQIINDAAVPKSMRFIRSSFSIQADSTPFLFLSPVLRDILETLIFPYGEI